MNASNVYLRCREFEEKRGDREVDAVFSSLETVSELRDIGVPQLANHLAGAAPTNLVANLQVCNILSNEYVDSHD